MSKTNPHAYKEYLYEGPLSVPIHDFVKEKRRLGCKFNGEATLLKELSQFAKSEKSPPNILTQEFVKLWIEKQPIHSEKTHLIRCSIIRQLGEYMVRCGYTAYIAPHLSSGICEHGAFVPYIFSNDELKRFFRAADAIPQNAYSPFQHLFYPLLFRLLYCCGLRLNEALTLKVGSVDLTYGILSIRGAKFDKDRFVPMSDTLTQRCVSFVDARHFNADNDTLLFPAKDGGIYSHTAVYDKYRRILKSAGISYGGRAHGPRIHDFRHTFAVHSLRNWMHNGIDVNNALPYLSAYMGHANTQGTHTYLRLTAELFPEILAKTEAYAGHIVPAWEEVAYESH